MDQWDKDIEWARSYVSDVERIEVFDKPSLYHTSNPTRVMRLFGNPTQEEMNNLSNALKLRDVSGRRWEIERVDKDAYCGP